MTYSTSAGRQQLLDELAVAGARIAAGIACLTEAYERLDERSADGLEAELFRPAQLAYGAARRTHTAFAARHGLSSAAFEQPRAVRPAGPGEMIDRAVGELRVADETLATLQDSLLPVEVGDPDVRAGLAQVRELIGPLPGRAREILRTLGR